MLKIEEIKELVLFLKSEKVLKFKLQGLEGEFSPQAFVSAAPIVISDVVQAMDEEAIKRRLQKASDELLYHSAN